MRWARPWPRGGLRGTRRWGLRSDGLAGGRRRLEHGRGGGRGRSDRRRRYRHVRRPRIDPALQHQDDGRDHEGGGDADPDPDANVLVGDSVSDVIAAREAGIRSIGYANAASKRRALSDAGATIVVDDMATLSDADEHS